MEKPEIRRRRTTITAVVAVIATVSIGAYVSSRGGVAEILQLPPVLDKSTPMEQQGYRVVEIVRPTDKVDFAYQPSNSTVPSTPEAADKPGVARTNIGKDAAVAGVWITTPQLPIELNQTEVSSRDFENFPLTPTAKKRMTPSYIRYLDNRPTVPPFYVSERTSTGQSFPADWRFFPLSVTQVLFVPIPGGYSSKLRWIDIIVTDQLHRVMKWRINRLPAARQALPTSPRFVERASFRGATITARAIRYFGDGIRIDRLPQVPVDRGQQWEVDYDAPVTNWEPVMGDLSSTDKTSVILTDPDMFKYFQMRSYLTRCATIETPFADEDTSVEQSGTLMQFDTLTETVHFRHVPLADLTGPMYQDEGIFGLRIPSPISQTTPSGIKVTLCKQNPNIGGRSDVGLFSYISSLNVKLAISPYPWDSKSEWPGQRSSQSIRLPASPLVRRYNRPVSLKADFAVTGVPAVMAGGTGGSVDAQSDEYLVGFTNKYPISNYDFLRELKRAGYIDIDVKVTQRVDLSSMPFTLTLPLHDPVASDRLWNSPWNPLIK